MYNIVPLLASVLCATTLFSTGNYHASVLQQGRPEYRVSDGAYKQVRLQLDRTSREEIEQLAKKAATLTEPPANPLERFRLCYAFFKAGGFHFTSRLLPHKERVLFTKNVLNAPPVPKNSEYRRLLFFVQSRDYPTPAVRQAGETLLKADPNDDVVKFGLAGVLQSSDVPADRARSLRYKQELAQAHPKDFSYRSGVAAWYWDDFLRTKNSKSGETAIAHYEESINLAPANHPWRDFAKRQIEQIRTLHSQQKP